MKYKTIFILLVTLFFYKENYSQKITDSGSKAIDIIGTRQAGSDKISSTLLANFQFYKSKKFIYNINGYADLNPVYSISGSYRVENDVLFLRIEMIKQLSGFKVIEASPGFQFGSFVLDGGKLISTKQNDSTFSQHTIQIIESKQASGKKSIEIDHSKYFRISHNPGQFSK